MLRDDDFFLDALTKAHFLWNNDLENNAIQKMIAMDSSNLIRSISAGRKKSHTPSSQQTLAVSSYNGRDELGPMDRKRAMIGSILTDLEMSARIVWSWMA
jgi:hypothetical protein